MQTKAERVAYKKAFREENKEEIAAYKKAWKEANKDKVSAHNRAYYIAHKETASAQKRAWNKANRGARNAAEATRRAAKLERTPLWSTSEFEKFAIKEAYICSRERQAATGVKHQVDHIIPLQGVMVSGLHVAANLQVITAKENGEKSNKFNIEEFNNEA